MSRIPTIHRQHHTAQTLKHIDFGWGSFETNTAQPGDFCSDFSTFAIVVTQTPSCGVVRLNGVSADTSAPFQSVFSTFHPGDQVAGSFIRKVQYDILLLDPAYIKNVLRSELNNANVELPSALRVETPPLLACLWTKLRTSVIETSNDNTRCVEDLIRILLILLVQPQLSPTSGSKNRNGQSSVRQVIDHIDGHLDADLNAQDLASVAGLSMFHFCRVFKQETGLSVHKFVLERRLQKARQMLFNSTENIASIAHDCGFSSQSHMTTAFRQRFAVTPGAFRAKARPTPHNQLLGTPIEKLTA